MLILRQSYDLVQILRFFLQPNPFDRTQMDQRTIYEIQMLGEQMIVFAALVTNSVFQ